MNGITGRPAQLPSAPTVSVGVPVYNGSRFLRECLDSLLAQTCRNIEIIISDNASTDDTPRIAAEYARRDARVRFVRADSNRGSAWNHNNTVDLAVAPYFKWVGADDKFDPRFLEACVAALEGHPEAVMAFPRSIVIDGDGTETARTEQHLPMDSPDPVVRFRCLQNGLPVTQNMFYGVMRTRAMRQARPLGAFLATDRCLLAELSLLGPFMEVPDFLMYRRIHSGNIRSRDVEQRLYKPLERDTFRTRELRVLGRQLTSVARSPLGVGTKLRLLGRVASWTGAQHRALAGELLDLVRAHAERLFRPKPSVPVAGPPGRGQLSR